MDADERRSAFIRVHLSRKAFATNTLHAISIKSFARSAFDKLHDQVIDAVHAFEAVETVCAARHDDVKTIRQSLRRALTIRWRRYGIPFASQNQNRYI